MPKTSLAVIFGGCSTEHDISVISAGNVVENLDKDLYDIHMIYISRKGEWSLFSDGKPGAKAIISPDTSDKGIIAFENGGVRRIIIDTALIMLHGKNGEDGTVQGLLELAGIPYTGSGVLSSALCMDKAVAKYIFAAYNIPQVEWLLFTPDSSDSEITSKIEEKFSYPVFVKPSNVGSSIGTAKVDSAAEAVTAVRNALQYDSKVLVERFINAREIECAVMGNSEPRGAMLGEVVVAKNNFYDYEAKYSDGGCTLHVPANVDVKTEHKIHSLAVTAYKAAGCNGFARVDFFIDKVTGEVLLNEINTIPGFTGGSLFPITWSHTGSPVGKTLDEIIRLASEK